MTTIRRSVQYRLSWPTSSTVSTRSCERARRECAWSSAPANWRRRCRGCRGSSRPGTAGSVAAVVHAFVLIDAEPARIATLAGELADVDGVAEVYSVAGEADLVAIVRVRHH